MSNMLVLAGGSVKGAFQAGVIKALAENVHRFEVAHGEIKDTEQPTIPLNFGPAGQA